MGELITRKRLGRELTLNAASKPLNIGVPAIVVVTGLLLGTSWLLPVAVLVYLGMVVATLFDEKEATRVGQATYEKKRARERPALDAGTLAPAIALQLERARREEASIRSAVAGARLAPADLVPEVGKLLSACETLATRAQRLHDYLGAGDDERGARQRLRRLRADDSADAATATANAQAAAAVEDHLAARAHLAAQLSRVEAQMEHIAATLGTIHAQVVRMSVTEEAARTSDVSSLMRDLRRQVGVAVEALEETYREE